LGQYWAQLLTGLLAAGVSSWQLRLAAREDVMRGMAELHGS
jgi:hypothetical protein